MIEKIFRNTDMDIELRSFINDKQNVWIKGKDIAKILGYSKTENAIKRHVSEENKMRHICWHPVSGGQQNASNVGVPKMGAATNSGIRGKYYTFINEPVFYKLVVSSKLEIAKKFRQWVFTTVLPSVRKYGQYKCLIIPIIG